jgi:hypothetical protein
MKGNSGKGSEIRRHRKTWNFLVKAILIKAFQGTGN